MQSDTPQFIVFTADDAVQSYTLDAVNQFLAHRKNPNGCAPKMTYFASLNYTNYTLVTGKHDLCLSFIHMQTQTQIGTLLAMKLRTTREHSILVLHMDTKIQHAA